MAAQKKTEVNLLPQKGFEATTTGRVLAWILSTFRIIVIVTEIIVMIAFLSRFILDAQNSDLDDKLEEKSTLLSTSYAFEKDFRDVQKRLTIFSEMLKNNVSLSNYLTTIANSLPDNLFLNSVSFDGNSFSIEGTALNEQNIQQFIVNLRGSNLFQGVNLNEISSDKNTENLLTFRLDASLQKTENQVAKEEEKVQQEAPQ